MDVAWVALSLTEHIGSSRIQALLAHFSGDLNAALQADESTLRQVPGIGAKIAAAIKAIDREAVARDIARWQADGLHLWTLLDDYGADTYPMPLRTIDEPPPLLFGRGSLRRFTNGVAVVGTRQPSTETKLAAWQLGYQLAVRSYTVVSGLALGVDALAHDGALRAGGATVAVLGSGVQQIYPPQNAPLAGQIMAQGVLLSEVHPRTRPKPTQLVSRNRIISGLCSAVIVVESAVDGGAMHAARYARSQGRDLYTLDLPASGNRALLDDDEWNAHAITADLDGFRRQQDS